MLGVVGVIAKCICAIMDEKQGTEDQMRTEDCQDDDSSNEATAQVEYRKKSKSKIMKVMSDNHGGSGNNCSN